jgi:hypothetical protein
MPHSPHPLVTQLRLTRGEFARALRGPAGTEASRQQLGQPRLPQFLGTINEEASLQPG